MKNLIRFLSLSAGIVILGSCSTLSYSPKVSLDVSPTTIQKTVLIEKFVDVSPAKDKENPFLGSSVTNKESLTSELGLEVTNAIAADLSVNGVFKQVSRRVENPDLVMKGEIKRFYGKSELNNFAKITWIAAMSAFLVSFVVTQPEVLLVAAPILLWYTGIPINKNTSEIEIEVSLYDQNNTLISSYTGKAYDRVNTNLYKNKTLAVPSMTNRNFSKAMQHIREEMTNDGVLK